MNEHLSKVTMVIRSKPGQQRINILMRNVHCQFLYIYSDYHSEAMEKDCKNATEKLGEKDRTGNQHLKLAV